MDDAKVIVNGAITNHQKMIKKLKGVPGVKPERYKEAFTVRHCALSLVGEPIMYPQINEFLDLLHGKGISSFLVTNAQFPERIRNLNPCTQLYVSIDAATKDTLKAVDRPLFKDFWERFISSLKALRGKNITRTVYRLTLVKEWNMGDVSAYCKLLTIGLPLLIEIKAVTYCGDSKASSLTIKNTPYHEEVCKFGEQICKTYQEMYPDSERRYELACEHEHSNCILIADTKLKQNGKWNTWIDYDKFQALYENWSRTGETFSAFQYMAPTPEWAVYGSTEHGFDPDEMRVRKKGKKARQERQDKEGKEKENAAD
uniref:tRNA 4-demethylwyosine synthase (AdoMet-dependent) n=1 Tax=Norrisiella sphaerica TaxID=552664 RepID=A0A7S2VUF2_9EUKA